MQYDIFNTYGVFTGRTVEASGNDEALQKAKVNDIAPMVRRSDYYEIMERERMERQYHGT